MAVTQGSLKCYVRKQAQANSEQGQQDRQSRIFYGSAEAKPLQVES